MKTYAAAILEGFEYVLETVDESFVIGQGLWSPWYVGATMRDLDVKYGRARIIDSPVSEAATTGAAVGAALVGGRPIVVHPRVDFAILALDPIVNQAAKWTGMFGPTESVPVTIRAIVNRGGSQGAQHSQTLHSWFAHIPGLRVVCPATPEDARDLLIAAVLCDDPVIYMDDRWLYEEEADLPPVKELDLRSVAPTIRRCGSDVTLVASGYSLRLALDAASLLADEEIDCEVVDVRVLNPYDSGPVVESIHKTNRLVVIDGDWAPSGFSAEVIASAAENLGPNALRAAPRRVTPMFASAPSAANLEAAYYPSVTDVADAIRASVKG